MRGWARITFHSLWCPPEHELLLANSKSGERHYQNKSIFRCYSECCVTVSHTESDESPGMNLSTSPQKKDAEGRASADVDQECFC